MRTKMLVAGLLVVLCMSMFPMGTLGEPYVDPWTKTFHYDGSAEYPILYWEAGDNITITLSNFTKGTGTTWIEVYQPNIKPHMWEYWESSDNWNVSGTCRFSTDGMQQTDVLSCWIIYVGTVRDAAYARRDGGDGEFDWNVTKKKSSYSKTSEASENLEKLEAEIASLKGNLQNMSGSIQNMSDNMTDLIDSLEKINTTMNEEFTEIQEGLSQNLSALRKQYDLMNDTLNNLDMNSTNVTNITEIINITNSVEANLTSISNNITKLQKAAEEYDLEAIDDVEAQLNDTLQDIASLSSELGRLKEGIPENYNDTNLTECIRRLEDENNLLRQEMSLMTNQTPDKSSDAASAGEVDGTTALAAGVGVGTGALVMSLGALYRMRRIKEIEDVLWDRKGMK